MRNYDIVGDVHGCLDELHQLLAKLGYDQDGEYRGCGSDEKQAERMLVFVGDLVDRGPASDGVLELLMDFCRRGKAKVLLGNHDEKLRKYLSGAAVKVGHMLAETLGQIEPRGEKFVTGVKDFLMQLPYRYSDAEAGLMVVHGAVLPGAAKFSDPEQISSSSSKEEKAWALYGQVAGTTDDGYPIRLQHWAHDYAGHYSTVVRGHSVVPQVEIIVSQSGACIYNVDTGCAYGGYLSALRFPEREVVQVKAQKIYYRSSTAF